MTLKMPDAAATSEPVERTAWPGTAYRVGDLVKLINGYPFDSERFSSHGTPLLRVRDLNSSDTETRYDGPVLAPFLIDGRDLLVGMDGDFNVGRWIGSEPALLNQRVLALRGSSDVVRWLEYALPEPLKQINDLTYSTTVKHLSSGQVRAIRIRLPENLADHLAFLDRETAEIDAFIADQEQLIELLTERRLTAIATAVQGRDRQVLSSGWLSDLPEEWQACRLRDISALQTGGTPSDVGSFSDEAGSPWYRPEDLAADGTASYASRMLTVTGARTLKRFRAQSTLICGIGATLGKVGWVDADGFCNQQITSATPRRMDARFHYFALVAARQEIVRLSVGNTLPIINNERLGALKLPVPPAAQQSQISERLDREVAQIDATIADAREAIALSKERRAALISAAVTGKIDVREHGRSHA